MCFPLNCCYRLSPRAKVSLQKIIERKAVVFARAPENKEQQHEARDNVAAEIVKRVVQKMAEGDDDQDAISASRVRRPRMTSAPAMSSMNGMVTPTAQSDQTGRNVSENGRKYFRACSSGPS